MSKRSVVAFALFIAAISALHAQQQGSNVTIFEGARLIVGDNTAPIENSAFIITGNTITRVGTKGALQAPAGATRVDLTGKTVIPALIDGHNHMGLSDLRDG